MTIPADQVLATTTHTALITATKHEGLGNDFLIVIDPARSLTPDDARSWCDRRLGVGADGLIWLDTTPSAPRMVLFNADGSRAEISGNGIRCVAQALARHGGMTGPARFTVDTDAGPRHLDLTPLDDAVVEVSVDMGSVKPGPPLYDHWSDRAVDVERQASVDLGNPHLVALVDELDRYDMGVVGPAVESAYPDGLNVHLIAVDDRSRIRLKVWERGSGVTQACGSGASAAGASVIDWGLADSPVAVEMPGGQVTISLTDEGTVTLTGPARFIATVELPDRSASHG